MPAPHQLNFLPDKSSSSRPTNSVKALKASPEAETQIRNLYTPIVMPAILQE